MFCGYISIFHVYNINMYLLLSYHKSIFHKDMNGNTDRKAEEVKPRVKLANTPCAFLEIFHDNIVTIFYRIMMPWLHEHFYKN